ncbi:hypothetical protein SDC9_41912 [bioreactor metagenome]|uniref:Uncharacterized protein n=1 Tax=bioreactor metagenome TaxID=1076179 RepID=A0A644VX00_9ZZZZ
MEHLVGVGDDLLLLGEGEQPIPVPFLCNFTNPFNAGIGFFGNEHLVLHPIDVLGKSQLRQVVMVIGVVVQGDEHPHLVEAVNQQALLVQIGKADGADDGIHSLLSAPGKDRRKEKAADLDVVDDVVTGEPHVCLFLGLVELVVDQGGDPPDNLSILFGKKCNGLTIFECRILSRVEVPPFIEQQGRYIAGVVPIQCIGKFKE